MKKPTSLLRAMALATAGLGLVLASGCKTKPPVADQYTPTAGDKVQLGKIRPPVGYDVPRAKKIAQNQRIKVGTQLTAIEEAGNEKLLFPSQIARDIGVTPAQMRRRFMDTMLAARRFEVFDLGVNVVATEFDIIIDAQVTDSRQELVNIEGGARAVVTTVAVSVQGKNMAQNGEPLFPTAVRVQGVRGRSTGARLVIGPRDNIQTPEMQRRLAQEYSLALDLAYQEVTTRVADVLRPMARVLSASGNRVSLVGGFAHGFQAGDELVVFRSKIQKLAGGEVFTDVVAVAVVRCEGVGTDSSQCDVFRRDPEFQVQKDDYAVLSTVYRPRQE
jgi:hypothetical protein